MSQEKIFHLDFICVGAEKCGTTWLDDCLREHPDLALPFYKEIHFFNDYIHFETLSDPVRNYVDKGVEWYTRNFPCVSNKVVGEINPVYLHRRECIDRILILFPHVKLIIMLRDPVDRLVSNYHYYKYALGIDKSPTIWEAIEEHPEYVERSMYFAQLERYANKVANDKLLVITLDEIKLDPSRVYRRVCDFISVSANSTPIAVKKKSNSAKQLKSVAFDRWMRAVPRKIKLAFNKLGLGRLLYFLEQRGVAQKIWRVWHSLRKKVNMSELRNHEISDSEKDKLAKLFVEDVKKLSKVIDNDISGWRSFKLR